MPSDAHISNIYQQTTSVQYTNNYNKLATLSLNMFFHHSLNQIYPLRPQNIYHYTEPFVFVLSNTQLSSPPHKQNHMSILSPTLEMIPDLISLCQFYLPSLPNLVLLDPMIKTLLHHLIDKFISFIG